MRIVAKEVLKSTSPPSSVTKSTRFAVVNVLVFILLLFAGGGGGGGEGGRGVGWLFFA